MPPPPALRQRLGLLGIVSLTAGLVVAGILMPVVGGLGLLARNSAEAFDRLPSALRIGPLPLGSKILAANGKVLATFYSQNRIPVSIDQVPAVMQKAIIAIEDSRFYVNNGIDLKGLIRAAIKNSQAGGVVQGGSTLTQQYVKNVLIDSAQTPEQVAAARADTLARKIQEAKYAIALGHRMTKAQILEGYLNIAYFGDGAYGVGSAAEHYFGVPVSKLSLPQAATLAGVVENPAAYDPAQHPVHAKARRDTVLARMAQLHMISEAEAAQAEATPVRLHLTASRNGCVGTVAPYFCDYVVHEILADSAFGATPEARAKLLNEGGLTIRTTLDPKVQAAAQAAVDHYVPWSGSFGSAEAVIQPGTGAIRAMVLNAPYGPDSKHGQNAVNWAVDEAYGASGGFPSGSSFKIFVLAAAIKEGIPLSTTINSPPQIGPLTGYTGCPAAGTEYPLVHNAETAEGGRFNVLTGTWASVNTFYAQLELRTGMCEPATIAASAGLQRADGHPIQQVPSMVLGSNEVSPLDMANAYATFAASGMHCAPIAVTAVTDRSGQHIAVPKPNCQQVIDPAVANTVTAVLQGVLNNPLGTAYGQGLGAQPAAGKTGTVDSFHAAWFAGYTPQYAAAVWVGFPHGNTQSLTNVTIGGHFYANVFGATLPAPIWHQTLATALAGVPVQDFPPASAQAAAGTTVSVPDVTGQSPTAALATLSAAGFAPTVSGAPVNSTVPAGQVAGTSPPAGTAAPRGSVVTVFVSNGKPPPPPPSSSPPTAGPSPSPPPKRHGHH